MKKIIYGVGLALLPVSYVSLMYLTEQPIEWSILALMALIVLPILVLHKKISAIETQFNQMSDQDKIKTTAKVAKQLARRSTWVE